MFTDELMSTSPVCAVLCRSFPCLIYANYRSKSRKAENVFYTFICLRWTKLLRQISSKDFLNLNFKKVWLPKKIQDLISILWSTFRFSRFDSTGRTDTGRCKWSTKTPPYAAKRVRVALPQKVLGNTLHLCFQWWARVSVRRNTNTKAWSKA